MAVSGQQRVQDNLLCQATTERLGEQQRGCARSRAAASDTDLIARTFAPNVSLPGSDISVLSQLAPPSPWLQQPPIHGRVLPEYQQTLWEMLREPAPLAGRHFGDPGTIHSTKNSPFSSFLSPFYFFFSFFPFFFFFLKHKQWS